MEEEKELLLKDLSARLPYGVKVHCEWNLFRGNRISEDGELVSINTYADSIHFKRDSGRITEIPFNRMDGTVLPYLRPMSSMTEEEKKEIIPLFSKFTDEFGKRVLVVRQNKMTLYQDWLNAKYFDYRGLIERGLAIAVTEDNNPYKEK